MLHLLVVSLIVSLSMVGHVGGLTMDAALSTGRYVYTVLVVININVMVIEIIVIEVQHCYYH